MVLRRRARGFTLVELMVVVMIVGVMAAIGLQVFSQQVSSSKGIEALSMVQSIRAAQERHRAMHTVYLNVSVSESGWYPRDPSTGGVGRERRSFYHPAAGASHGDNARWWQLKPTVSGAVHFGYQTNAGLPGTEMTAVAVDGLTWPEPTEPWYVIQCIADANGNGTLAYYVASSVNNEVYRKNDGE